MKFNFDWEIIARTTKHGRKKGSKRVPDEIQEKRRKEYQHKYYMTVTKKKRQERRRTRESK